MAAKTTPKVFYGELPVKSLYTVGIAGEKFFRNLKDKGKILGTRCNHCNYVYVPPKIYCERCFENLEDWVEVSDEGTLKSYTKLYIGIDGKRLAKPEVIGLINLYNSDTVIVHRLQVKEPKIGMRVKAVLKPKKARIGAMTDIKYFREV